ncbi:tubulin epsilon chain-like [Prorops nasuta]|uniref:tubulin epsilon chain-like n=1 Tax=Prorops nasuta TaxID=863751 RepID=UPI0034CDB070
MSEFITIQVGQCGNQVGSIFWPLVLHEYGIDSNAYLMDTLRTQKTHKQYSKDLLEAFHSFFYVPKTADVHSFKNISDLNSAKVRARAVLIDMEDSVVSRFKEGPLRKLFDQTYTISNYPGSGNNWAMGYCTHGMEYKERISEAIRKTAERCDQLHGFLLMHSAGGGTGSGLGSFTLELLKDCYSHVSSSVSCVYPNGTEDVITAPYNTLLTTNKLIQNGSCIFPAMNKALLDICKTQASKQENLYQASYTNSCLPFQDMNSILVNMLLHLTCGSRLPGSLNVDMSDLATNLVPYPHLNYIFSSVSPVDLVSSFISNSTNPKLQDQLFTNAWSRNNQLLKIDPFQPGSLILSAVHLARGNSSLSDLQRNVVRFQNKANFTPWSKEAIKLGLCSIPPAGHSSSVLCLLNSSAITHMFVNMIQNFQKLYKRKAHVHHYTEITGFDESFLMESKETVFETYERYIEIQNQKPVEIPRLQLI